jgi:hypothetical protein
MNGNGSTKVHAASFQVRCFSIPMENVVRADVIVKTLQKQSVLRPVIAACRAHALAVQEPYGIWGGLSEDDRLAILGKEVTPDVSHAS